MCCDNAGAVQGSTHGTYGTHGTYVTDVLTDYEEQLGIHIATRQLPGASVL